MYAYSCVGKYCIIINKVLLPHLVDLAEYGPHGCLKIWLQEGMNGKHVTLIITK